MRKRQIVYNKDATAAGYVVWRTQLSGRAGEVFIVSWRYDGPWPYMCIGTVAQSYEHHVRGLRNYKWNNAARRCEPI
jgi:hypothetical protein